MEDLNKMAEKKSRSPHPKPKHKAPSVADVETDALKSFHKHRKKRKNMQKLIDSGMIKKDPTGRDIDDFLRSLMPKSIALPQSKDLEPDSELWGRSTGEKVKRIRARNKKKTTKKKGGGAVRQGRGMGAALRGGGAVTRS